jgi:hypothetical protein
LAHDGRSATPPRIQRCALPSCTGGPQDLATVEADAHSLASDDKFVYWAQSTSFLRIAK